MDTNYDVIVIGLGAMGSSATYHLAQRGARVLGLDAHPRGHTLGSSHGKSRIIREAYFEAPDYVPLVQRAYALWRELEAESGRSLLTITGGLNLGRPESAMVSGALASARTHGLPYELLTPAEVHARFAGFKLPDDFVGVFEPNAGFLDPEACVAAHLDLGARHGATVHHEEPVLRWSATPTGVRVETARASYIAGGLVIAAGPWANELLADLALPLEIQRVVNVHFAPRQPDLFDSPGSPVFLIEAPEGDYYGFPNLPGQGVKIGRHDAGERCTARTVRRTVDPEEIDALRDVLDRYLPGAAGEVIATLTCMYTNTPDRHFILDSYPGQPRVAYGAGFSGHGFKFSSVIGEILADLATNGSTALPIAFLSADRLRAGSASTRLTGRDGVH